MVLGLMAENSLDNCLIHQVDNDDVEVDSTQRVVPFLRIGNVCIKLHVHWLVIVPELMNQYVAK
eukprot:961726-Ditylum_brightwellii.AAC.1